MSTTLRRRVAEPGYSDVADIARLYEEMSKANYHQRRIQVRQLLENGIYHGHVLELGPGPGLTGFDWLEHTTGTRLTGLDLSPEMLELTRKNAVERDLTGRTTYYQGNGEEMPFAEDSFDAVYSFNSLHEWDSPEKVFDEIFRVLRPGGHFLVGDLRRDLPGLTRWFMSLYVPSRDLKKSFIDSVRAGYILAELREIIAKTHLSGASIVKTTFGLQVTGIKKDDSMQARSL